MLKILHLADVHFDTTFGCRSKPMRIKLRKAIHTAFVRAIDAALEEEVDAVLLAGDLFDGERLSFTTEKLLVDQFRRLRDGGIQVYSVCGNHDPASLRSRAGRIEWPDNCIVFSSGTPETVEIRSSDGTVRGIVVGAGHESSHEDRNLAQSFPGAAGDLPHIGLLHTMVTSAVAAETHDRYAPCSIEDLTRRGYDYWALGHIHQRQAVGPEETVWYPGNIQGRNPRESGPKGGLLVRVHKGRPPEVAFLAFAPVEWVVLKLTDLSSVGNLTQFEHHVEKAFSRYGISRATEDCILIVELGGELSMADELRSPAAAEELESLLADQLGVSAVELRTERLLPAVSVKEHEGEPHVLGEVLRVISRFGEVPEAIDRVAPVELGHPVTNPGDRLGYLRGLLDGLDREAVRRLFQSD